MVHVQNIFPERNALEEHIKALPGASSVRVMDAFCEQPSLISLKQGMTSQRVTQQTIESSAALHNNTSPPPPSHQGALRGRGGVAYEAGGGASHKWEEPFLNNSSGFLENMVNS